MVRAFTFLRTEVSRKLQHVHDAIINGCALQPFVSASNFSVDVHMLACSGLLFIPQGGAAQCLESQ
jgi:hypothetical protein